MNMGKDQSVQRGLISAVQYVSEYMLMTGNARVHKLKIDLCIKVNE